VEKRSVMLVKSLGRNPGAETFVAIAVVELPGLRLESTS
jgi:hypothetical protein